MKNAKAIKKTPKIEITAGEHFAYRMIQKSLPLGGIGALQSQLCQTKIGSRIAILSNKTILVAERVHEKYAVLVTGWNASISQIHAINNNETVEVNLGRGKHENMSIISA
jgi:hypothetical protein